MSLTRKIVKIEVTENDIKNGIRYDPYRCPVFLAAKRQRLGIIDVSSSWISFTGKRKLPTPYDAYLWINAFDNGEKVKPATFTLTIPALEQCRRVG